MKKKKHNASDKIVDFTDIRLKMKKSDLDQALDGIAELDFYEFRIAMVNMFRASLTVANERDQDLAEVVKKVASHLKYIHSKLKYLDEILFMENVRNQEHREGSMSVEQKTSLAKLYGIDFKKWSARASRKQKRKLKEDR